MSTKPAAKEETLPVFDAAVGIRLADLMPVLVGVAVITGMSLSISPFTTGQRQRAQDNQRI